MTRLSCMLPLNSFQSPCALPRLLCSLGHPTRLFQGGMSRSNVSFRGCPQLVHAARLRPYERVQKCLDMGPSGGTGSSILWNCWCCSWHSFVLGCPGTALGRAAATASSQPGVWRFLLWKLGEFIKHTNANCVMPVGLQARERSLTLCISYFGCSQSIWELRGEWHWSRMPTGGVAPSQATLARVSHWQRRKEETERRATLLTKSHPCLVSWPLTLGNVIWSY